MIRRQLTLDIAGELIVDNFAGGGGASTGIELALGRHVDHAINHDRMALGMHCINHPQTVHHCEDVFDIDPATVCGGRPVGLAHFSPDCKHFSKAKGGKPLDKRIRGLVLVMLRWAKYGARVMTMENVTEIVTWGPLKYCPERKGHFPDPEHRGRTWKAFLACLGDGIDPDHPDLQEILTVLGDTVTREELVHGFRYQYQAQAMRGCDYGSPTIRMRLFMVARRDGQPIRFPSPTHASRALLADLDPDERRLKPHRAIAECIDWALPCPSIFLTSAEAKRQRCRRPLTKPTLRRIAAGVDKYVLKAADPFIVSVTHHGGDRVENIRDPARTITGANRGEKALVTPFVTEHANSSSPRNMPADEPMRTQCAQVKGGHFALAAASMVKLRGDSETHGPTQDLADPAHTISAGGNHHGIVAASMIQIGCGEREGQAPRALDINAPGGTAVAGGCKQALVSAYVAQHNAGFCNVPGHDARKPLSTVSSRGAQQTIVAASALAYYGSEADGQAVSEPARTVTAKPRLGVVESFAVSAMTPQELAGARRVAAFLCEHGVQFEGEFATVAGCIIVDLGMRMLTPRELFRAQGFPNSYVIDRAWVHDGTKVVEMKLTKEQQIRMCGNSVCPDVMLALVKANVPELSAWFKDERKQERRSA